MVTKKQKLILVLSLFLLVAVSAVVLAQTSAGFSLTWNVLGGSGGKATSAGYQVDAAIGQPLSSPPVSTGPAYRVSGGYWFVELGSSLYLPSVVNN